MFLSEDLSIFSQKLLAFRISIIELTHHFQYINQALSISFIIMLQSLVVPQSPINSSAAMKSKRVDRDDDDDNPNGDPSRAVAKRANVIEQEQKIQEQEEEAEQHDVAVMEGE